MITLLIVNKQDVVIWVEVTKFHVKHQITIRHLSMDIIHSAWINNGGSILSPL